MKENKTTGLWGLLSNKQDQKFTLIFFFIFLLRLVSIQGNRLRLHQPLCCSYPVPPDSVCLPLIGVFLQAVTSLSHTTVLLPLLSLAHGWLLSWLGHGLLCDAHGTVEKRVSGTIEIP